MKQKAVLSVQIWHEGIRGTTQARTAVSVRSADGESQILASVYPGHVDVDKVAKAMGLALDIYYPGRPF